MLLWWRGRKVDASQCFRVNFRAHGPRRAAQTPGGQDPRVQARPLHPGGRAQDDRRLRQHCGRSAACRRRFRGRENRLELSAHGDAGEAAEGSDVEFITEHYWGYARRKGGRTTEYRVEHPRWRVSTATATQLDCDVAALYGSQFVEFLKAPPASAFLADGSKVAVFRGTSLPSREDR